MRSALLAGSAALSLLFVTSGVASAFDDVDWTWDAKVNENIDIDVKVDAYFEPDGLVQVEKLQAQIGDVKAISVVKDVEFDPSVDDGKGGGWGGWDVKVEAGDPVDLPAVLSSATAVGNNQSITTDVPVLLHDTQIVVGGVDDGKDWGSYFGNGGSDFSDVLDGDLSDFSPADITAISAVDDIDNAYVDSSATAVGNNISIDMQDATQALAGGGWGASISNALLIADITQVNYADVFAGSFVNDVSVHGGFTVPSVDGVAVPLVNSVATAVGNNVSINVSVPDVAE
jgi:hypothetical protein